jgi:hypothetical protein
VLNKYPGYRVVVFDKLTYAGNLDNLQEVKDSDRFIFVQGDIQKTKFLHGPGKTVQSLPLDGPRLMQGDAVFYNAAEEVGEVSGARPPARDHDNGGCTDHGG